MANKADGPITPNMLSVLEALAKTPQGMEYLAKKMQANYPEFSAQVGDLASKLIDLEQKIRQGVEKGKFQQLPSLDMTNGAMYVHQAIVDSNQPNDINVNLFFDLEEKLGLSYELNGMTLKDWCAQVGKNPEDVLKAMDSYFWMFMTKNKIEVQEDKLIKDGKVITGDAFKALLNLDNSYLNNLKTFSKEGVKINIENQAPMDLKSLPTEADVDNLRKQTLPPSI